MMMMNDFISNIVHHNHGGRRWSSFNLFLKIYLLVVCLPLVSLSFATTVRTRRTSTTQWLYSSPSSSNIATHSGTGTARSWRLYGATLKDYDSGKGDDETIYDVAIIGSGPASCSLAALLTAAVPSSSNSSPPKVVVLSKFADKRWVPNYGCWTDEWKILNELYASRGVSGLMERGVDIEWKDTDCFFEEDNNIGRAIGKAYVRLSRDGLKDIFYGQNDGDRNYNVIKQDVLGRAAQTNVFFPADSINFHETYTELTLKESGEKVRARIVVDGTGAESPFTIREDRDQEGYQIAYGVECNVEGSGVTQDCVGDYDRSKMTLFDWRMPIQTDEANEAPTFNYVMPLSDDVIFFEETSLVANPAMSFQDCKDRLTKRMARQNVKITNILEEEFCYIPMGGGLPRKGQRIVPIGAAAGLVHPSTGYQVGRCFASNLDVAKQILYELQQQQDVVNKKGDDSFDPDAAAARIIGRTWTPEAIRQRNFAVFGGEFFMAKTAKEFQQFFAGFFELDPDIWCSFLAGWKYLPGYEKHNTWWSRLQFGLTALTKLPVSIGLSMALSIVSYCLQANNNGIALVQSVTPLAGEPETYDSSLKFRGEDFQGDIAAKEEAMEMLCNCDRCEEASTNQEEGAEITA